MKGVLWGENAWDRLETKKKKGGSDIILLNSNYIKNMWIFMC